MRKNAESKKFIPLVLCVGLVIAVASVSPAIAASTLDKIKKDGFIRVAFANEAPYGYATPVADSQGWPLR